MPEISDLTGQTVARISNVLHDPKYIGENQGIRMISDELWEAVQNRLNGKKRRRTKDEMEQTYILTSKMVCSCGDHMVGKSARKTGKQRYGYYACSKATRGACSNHRYINRMNAEEAVLGALKCVLEAPEAIEEQVEAVYSKYQDQKPTGDVREAVDRLKTTEKAIENILQAVEQGMDYNLVKDRLEALQSKREIELEEIRKCKTGVRSTLSKEMIRVYLEGGKNIQDRKQMIDYYVQSIVWDGAEYNMALNISDDVRINSQSPQIIKIKAKTNI